MTTAEEQNANGRMVLHWPYPYLDINLAPNIYYSSVTLNISHKQFIYNVSVKTNTIHPAICSNI